jgi:transposase
MPHTRLDDYSRPPTCRGGDPKKGVDEALGRLRGGFSTKLHLADDAKGRPLELTVTPGQEHDICQAPRLLADHESPYVIADKGYDSDELVRHVEKRGSAAVIPSRSGRTTPRRLLKRQYRRRNHVERFVSRIKHFRRVTTRYEKTPATSSALSRLPLCFLGYRMSTRPSLCWVADHIPSPVSEVRDRVGVDSVRRGIKT